MLTLQEAASHFRKSKKNGNYYVAQCPAHQDSSPSLTIRENDGQIWLKCHAGCDNMTILAAAGLDVDELRPPLENKGGGGCTLQELAVRTGIPSADLMGFGLRDGRYNGAPAVEIPAFDASGVEVKVKYRVKVSGGDKYRGKGDNVPYGLEQKPKKQLVLVEGETDALALRHTFGDKFRVLGIPGASAIRCLKASHLVGAKKILIIGDADKAGLEFEASAIKHLRETLRFSGPVRSLSPQLGNDIVEWRSRVQQQGEDFGKEFIEAARTLSKAPGEVTRGLVYDRKLRTEYAWAPYAPMGTMTIISGDPGDGKSIFALSLAAAVQQGRGTFCGEPIVKGGTVYVSTEDQENVIAGRYELAGGAPGTLRHLIETEGFSLDRAGIERIRIACENHKPSLVILDPILTYLPQGVSEFSQRDVVQTMRPLLELAKTMGFALIGLHHLNRSSDPRSAQDRVSGSRAWTSLSRSVLQTYKDPENKDPEVRRYVMAQAKQNNRPGDSLRYQVLSHPENEDIPVMKFLGTSPFSADQLSSMKPITDPRKVQDCVNSILMFIEQDHRLLFPGKEFKNVFAEAGHKDFQVVKEAAFGLGFRYLREGAEWVFILDPMQRAKILRKYEQTRLNEVQEVNL